MSRAALKVSHPLFRPLASPLAPRPLPPPPSVAFPLQDVPSGSPPPSPLLVVQAPGNSHPLLVEAPESNPHLLVKAPKTALLFWLRRLKLPYSSCRRTMICHPKKCVPLPILTPLPAITCQLKRNFWHGGLQCVGR